ncbi:MAG: chaperone NapD [Candidatus Electrothrix sp. GW3-4]|uniref:chaperone NapD n=1 Tax=Candidatus Electrothrix sp. GW3-4 TaxID=3126740 RepID=UPI0030D5C595
MNISGIVVRVSPDTSEAVQQRLAEFSGVEIHAVNNDEGSIVITLEDTPDNVPSDVMMDVQKTQGVLAASLIYNYCDEECV